MLRRDLMVGCTSIAFSSLLYGRADAGTNCVPDPQVGQVCWSGIASDHVVTAWQKESQWCWAASVEMVFAHYGYSVSQARIVEETYGVVENIPAVTGYAISKNLQRDWEDDSGREFAVEIDGLYDFDAGLLGITDRQIVMALDEERPLILGTQSHAVLFTAVQYVPTSVGPKIVDLRVADPFPGMGLHGPRSQADMVPMHMGGNLRYLCLPRVS
jgi:nuclear transport factor 2 (NTF2) superfamily protein